MSTLTAQERFLAERSEEAVVEGRQLLQWCRHTDLDSRSTPLDLKKEFRLAHRPTGYFGSLEINGVTTSVMGCRQKIDFGDCGVVQRQDLVDFMAAEFLPRAHWTYPDGAPGGFTVKQSLFKTAKGELGVFPEADQAGCTDWRKLGPEFEWVLLTLDIHDFVMEFGPFKKRMREAACVLPHRDFMATRDEPDRETIVEVSIGYPFVRFAPIPNFFGFGPGKFGTAIKLFTLRLGRDGRVRALMDFAAAPRCQKVLDFGPSWPDPVYGGAAVVEKLTFGLWKAQKLRDHLDLQMLAQHCRVHQALMDGAENVFRDWMKGRRG